MPLERLVRSGCEVSLRTLAAIIAVACGTLYGAATAPVMAQPKSPDSRAGLTFDLEAARLLLAQAAEEPAGSEEELSEEGFGDLPENGVPAGPSDPLEAINRPIFDFNLTLDRWVLRPVTRIYIETVPKPGRTVIANVLSNVRSPVILANDLLQGEMSRAGATLGRFFINTIFGLGGLFDTATAMGLPGHDEDFGQTLASYGIGGSPYLVLPFFGPSNPRDALGRAADVFMDPVTHLAPTEVIGARTGTGLVSDRSQSLNEVEALEATSIDFYAAVRSVYYQNREFEIGNREGGAAADEAAPAAAPDPAATPGAGDSGSDGGEP